MDRATFEQWIVELDEHFPGERSERILGIYWHALNGRLSTEEFEQACVEIIGSREFFPPWREFLEVTGKERTEDEMKAVARQEQEHVQRAIKDWRNAGPHVDQLSDVGRKALGQAGGVKALAMCDADELKWRLKEFRDAYVEIAGSPTTDRDELPPMSDEGRELVRDAMAGELNP